MKSLAQAGTTIIISSHILTELEAQTDEVAILSRGELRAFGPLARLRDEAGLQVRFVLRGSISPTELARDTADLGQVSRGRNTDVELTVPVARKMEALHRLATLGSRISDLDVENPGLDDVYRHFSRELTT